MLGLQLFGVCEVQVQVQVQVQSYFKADLLPAAPPLTGNLASLQELHLPENQITAVPPHLEMCCLQSLNLHQNRLTSFPDVRLPYMVTLNVGKNLIASLPQGLVDSMPLLESLICCGNRLTALPDLSACGRLVVLDAMANKIHTFPTLPNPHSAAAFGSGSGSGSGRGGREEGEGEFAAAPPVRRIARGASHGGDMPKAPLRGQAAPAAPPAGPVLSVVNLGSNSISTITNEQLQPLLAQYNLAELHLSGNRLQSLSSDLHCLQNLKMLDVSNNDLSDFPYELGYVDSLQIVNLEGNPIRSIRRTLIARADSNLTQDLKKFLRSRGEPPQQRAAAAGEFGAGAGAAVGRQKLAAGGGGRGAGGQHGSLAAPLDPLDYRIRDIADGGVLNLSKTLASAAAVPEEVFAKLFASHTLQALTRADFSGNALTSPPYQLQGVESVQTLVLAGNKLSLGLRDFGSRPWVSPSLRVLDVSNNGLTTEDAELVLTQARHLSSLDLSRNVLQSFPANVQYACSLRELSVSFNQIRQVSSQDLSKLPQLEVLDMSNNKLKAAGFPLATLQGHKGCMLRLVNFSNNDLNDIPYQYGYLANLQSLQLQGNGIKTLRQQVINGPIEALKNALRNRAPES